MFYVKFHKKANRSQVIKMLKEQYAVVGMPRVELPARIGAIYQLIFENNVEPEHLQKLFDKDSGLIFITEKQLEQLTNGEYLPELN